MIYLNVKNRFDKGRNIHTTQHTAERSVSNNFDSFLEVSRNIAQVKYYDFQHEAN